MGETFTCSWGWWIVTVRMYVVGEWLYEAYNQRTEAKSHGKVSASNRIEAWREALLCVSRN